MSKSIKNNQDYKIALSRVDGLLKQELTKTQIKELDTLVLLIEEYEDKHYKINTPSEKMISKYRENYGED